MKNTKKGFTLVELLVVIAILAILASVAVVGYSAFIGKAEHSKVQTELNQIKTSVNANLMIGADTVLYEATGVADATTTSVLNKIYVDGETGEVKTLTSTWVAAVGTEGEPDYVAAHAEDVIADATTVTLNGDYAGLLEGCTLTASGSTLTATWDGGDEDEEITFSK